MLRCDGASVVCGCERPGRRIRGFGGRTGLTELLRVAGRERAMCNLVASVKPSRNSRMEGKKRMYEMCEGEHEREHLG